MGDARFETILCDTAESRSIHYQIRYQVYCMETGFEDPDEFADRKEKDQLDGNSVHFMVRDPASGQMVGAMRLVLAQDGRMPSESKCNLAPIPEAPSERRQMVEFSRLCVVESHRRHNRDRSLIKVIDGRSGKTSSTVPHPRYPEILLSFIRATFAWSRENGVRYCYFLINRALARTLSRLSLDLTLVGDSCEHRGVRTPYLVDLRISEKRMLEKLSVFKELNSSGLPYIRYSAYDEVAATVMSEKVPRMSPNIKAISQRLALG